MSETLRVDWGCGGEAWRGFEYSRRYRLLLMYADHTVLHYELYYDWPRSAREENVDA